MELEKAIRTLRDETSLARLYGDEYIFGMVCYKYFFNNGEFNNSDFENTFVDGRSDGGIDLVAINDDEENNRKSLILIQSKYGKNINKEDIKNVFYKMIATVRDFRNGATGRFNEKLREKYSSHYDDIKDENNFSIELVLFVGKKNIDDSERAEIENTLNQNKAFEDYYWSIHDRDIINQEIEKFEEPNRYVKEDKITIFKKDGKIEMNHNGIMVNISALSLKNLFNKYKNKGLFEQNFRYYIVNKRIDTQIKDSLLKKREKFWFLNNGIIIACQSFRQDGENIKLENFSIVNGCQTTTLIGHDTCSNNQKDFAVHCKIATPQKTIDDFKGNRKEKEKQYEEHFEEFVAEIAEASNSQKPINDRDLKSNTPEQRKLKKHLAPEIYFEIKRGEKKPKLEKAQKWKSIKNDLYGQLFLAFVLQQPGTARNSKSKVFSNSEIYKNIFKIELDENLKNMVIDLSRLNADYENFISKEKIIEQCRKWEAAFDVHKKAKFFVLATIGFLIEHYRKQKNKQEIKNILIQGFSPKNLPDDYEQKLEWLFMLIIRKIVDRFQSGRYKAEGNFWKTDKPYLDDVTHGPQGISEELGSPLEKSKWDAAIIKTKCFEI